MVQSSDELYSSIWGEVAPQDLRPDPADGRSGPAQDEVAAVSEPEVQWALGNGRPTRIAAVPPPPVSRPPQAQSKNALELQLQIAESLRLLESRVSDMQRQITAFGRAGLIESLDAVKDASLQVSTAAGDLNRLMEHSQQIVQELGEIQAEARRGLAVLYERQKALDRPRRSIF